MFTFLTLTEKQLLVIGYIRLINIKTIPLEISKLCQQYYKHEFLWTITKQQFTKWTTSQPFDALRAPTNINACELQCKCMLIKINMMNVIAITFVGDINSREIHIYYEIVLNQTQTNVNNLLQKRTTKLEINNDKWKRIEIDIYELAKLFNQLDAITFCLHFELLNYAQNMHSQIAFKWVITENEYSSLKNKQEGIIRYSDNFGLDGKEINGPNAVFTMFCSAKAKEDDHNFGVMLLNLPQNIGELNIECIVSLGTGFGSDLMFKGEKWMKQGDCIGHIGYLRCQDDKIGYLDPEDMLEIDSIIFNVNIVIKNVKSLNDEEIAKHEWYKYHIIQNV